MAAAVTFVFALLALTCTAASRSEKICEHNFDCESCTKSDEGCKWTAREIDIEEKPKVFGCKSRKIPNDFNYNIHPSQCSAFDDKHNNMCRGKTSANACFHSHLRLYKSSENTTIIGCSWDRESQMCVNKAPSQFHPDARRYFHNLKHMEDIERWEKLESDDVRDFMLIGSGAILSLFVGLYVGAIICPGYM